MSVQGRAADVSVCWCTHAEILSLPLPVKLVDACALPSLFLCLRNISTSYERIWLKFGEQNPGPGSVDTILAVTLTWDSCHCECFVDFEALTEILFYAWKIQQAERTTNVKYNIVSPPITIHLNNGYTCVQLYKYKVTATMSVLIITYLHLSQQLITYC